MKQIINLLGSKKFLVLFFGFIVFSAAVLSGESKLSTNPKWSYLGPDNQGKVSEIITHPSNGDIIYVAVAVTSNAFPSQGIFRTVNGGRKWENVLGQNTQEGANALAINPQDSNILYAITVKNNVGSFYKTIDGGNSWQFISSGADYPRFKKLIVNRQNPSIIYAGTALMGEDCGGSGLYGIYKTTNEGLSWESIAFDGGCAFIAASESNPDIIYADAMDQILKSEDGGFSWTRLSARPSWGDIQINPVNAKNVFYSNGSCCLGPIFKTEDGGASWRRSDRGIDSNNGAESILFNRNNPNEIFTVAYNKDNLRNIFFSSDYGETWIEASKKIRKKITGSGSASIMRGYFSGKDNFLYLYLNQFGRGIYKVEF